MWRLLLSGTRGADWRIRTMSLVRNAFSLSWSLVYVNIAVIVGRSEMRNVRVGQAVREDAHKPGGFA